MSTHEVGFVEHVTRSNNGTLSSTRFLHNPDMNTQMCVFMGARVCVKNIILDIRLT